MIIVVVLGVLAIGLAVPVAGLLGEVWPGGTGRTLVDDNDPPEQQNAPPEQAVEPANPDPPVEPTATWSCGWDPTINDDWHDDVLCTDGLQSMRPLLLSDQDFVTKAEMMAAAREYEQQLNR